MNLHELSKRSRFSQVGAYDKWGKLHVVDYSLGLGVYYKQNKKGVLKEKFREPPSLDWRVIAPYE